MLLEIVAIALGVVAIFVSLGAFLLQKWQGERIAVSVISTTDQVYRRLRARIGEATEDEDDEDHVPEDVAESSISRQFIPHDTQVELRLSGYLSSSVMGGLEARCTVEDPSGRRAEVLRDVELGDGSLGSFDLKVLFPRDFANASTSKPGRYHVSWRLREEWVLAREGEQEYGSHTVAVCEGGFAVKPW